MSQESFFKSALRSFLKGSFAVLGFFAAILVLLVILSTFFSNSELSNVKVEKDHKIVLLTDAKGQRIEHNESVPVVLQLNIEGVIGMDKLTLDGVQKLLTESREGALKNNRVKGILLHINTPGGTVVDADGIYHALKEYKERYQVPIIAYVNGLCASGGMYVACAADTICATDVSIIGSVGVLIPTALNFSKLMENWGIEEKTITAGKDKDALNPLRRWKPDEGANYQTLIDYYYQLFVNVVTENRPRLNKENLIQEYGAKIFSAPKAREYGYIDESGISRSGALQKLLHQANIQDEQDYQVITLEDTNWVKQLFKNSEEMPIFGKAVRHQIQWQNDVDPSLEGKALYLYRP